MKTTGFKLPDKRGKALSDKLDKKPYRGILAQPMPKWTALTQPSDEEISALIDAKFKALFVHYEIDTAGAFEAGPRMASAWADLAWHLAREHVPGFRGSPRLRGKPATRKSDDVALVMCVELLKRRDNLSDRKAIKEIVAQNLISGTEQGLRQRYKRAKKSFEPLSRMYDNAVAILGTDALVHAMEEALSGDNKDTFLFPD